MIKNQVSINKQLNIDIKIFITMYPNVIFVDKNNKQTLLRNKSKKIYFTENKIINNIPNSIRVIIFTYCFNKLTDNLPEHITNITFGNIFNQLVNNLPNSILFLTFGDNFNQSVDKLPNSIIKIQFGINFKQPIHNLPNFAGKIKTTINNNQIVNKFLKSQAKLIFNIKCQKEMKRSCKLNFLPPTIEFVNLIYNTMCCRMYYKINDFKIHNYELINNDVLVDCLYYKRKLDNI